MPATSTAQDLSGSPSAVFRPCDISRAEMTPAPSPAPGAGRQRSWGELGCNAPAAPRGHVAEAGRSRGQAGLPKEQSKHALNSSVCPVRRSGLPGSVGGLCQAGCIVVRAAGTKEDVRSRSPSQLHVPSLRNNNLPSGNILLLGLNTLERGRQAGIAWLRPPGQSWHICSLETCCHLHPEEKPETERGSSRDEQLQT